MARIARQSADRSRDGEPFLAMVLWTWNRDIAGGLWQSRDTANASRIARLVGDRVHRQRLGHESDSQADRHECDVSAIGGDFAADCRERSRKRMVISPAALSFARLDATRSSIAISGLLVETIGGPSVRPYQPAGIWAEATFGKIKYVPDRGDGLYRRSLYTFWRRIVGPTMFFDSSKRQTCEVKPTRTNTPLHALTTLNETTFVEAARNFAQRVLQSDATTDAQRIDWAIQLATSRPATALEIETLSQRLQILRKNFADREDHAIELLQVGQSTRDQSTAPADHAAMTIVCSIILNLDETLTRQ